MKLLIENFRQFIIKEEIEKFIDNKTELTEQELRAFIKDLCSQKGIYLTEEQLNEWVPSAMKRFGRRAGMLAALGGAGAPVAAAAPGQGQMKDKITMMKQSVKDKAGDVKQKMQDLGVKIDDAGEEDAAEDVSQEVGKIVDNGDGSFSLTQSYKVKADISMAKRMATDRAVIKLTQELGDLSGYEVTGVSMSGDTMLVTVTATPAG
jgi:hypothetical protein